MRPEELVRACWEYRLPIAQLIELLDDDREWSSASATSFDGDSTTRIHVVSQAALWALAALDPTAAPIARVAATVLRLHGRTCEISFCTTAAPHEVPLRWTDRELAPFGAPLIARLQEALRDEDPDVRRRAREVLDG